MISSLAGCADDGSNQLPHQGDKNQIGSLDNARDGNEKSGRLVSVELEDGQIVDLYSVGPGIPIVARHRPAAPSDVSSLQAALKNRAEARANTPQSLTDTYLGLVGAKQDPKVVARLEKADQRWADFQAAIERGEVAPPAVVPGTKLTAKTSADKSAPPWVQQTYQESWTANDFESNLCVWASYYDDSTPCVKNRIGSDDGTLGFESGWYADVSYMATALYVPEGEYQGDTVVHGFEYWNGTSWIWWEMECMVLPGNLSELDCTFKWIQAFGSAHNERQTVYDFIAMWNYQ